MKIKLISNGLRNLLYFTSLSLQSPPQTTRIFHLHKWNQHIIHLEVSHLEIKNSQLYTWSSYQKSNISGHMSDEAAAVTENFLTGFINWLLPSTTQCKKWVRYKPQRRRVALIKLFSKVFVNTTLYNSFLCLKPTL